MADPNTRQGKRTPVTLKIKFKSETLEQFIERYAVDVSQGGIFIRTKEPLAVGTQMKFEFQLRDASPLIAGEGTVVWTRENDPSRPAIAPGMGVRFDKLAEGSQNVLERILAEKAKQAPSRGNESPTKPPMFTDTPTKVAPAPVQEALGVRGNRKREDSEQTPLPKPMPFHSDAEDFDERAFEEATKVRSLDELAAQTAGLLGGDGDGGEVSDDQKTNTKVNLPADELAARRQGRADSTLADPPVAQRETTNPGMGAAKAVPDRDSAPGLPSPPETARPRMLDTTPSPRSEAPRAPAGVDEASQSQRTKLGMEPAKAATAARGAASDSGIPQAVAAEPSRPYAPKRPSSAPIVIGILLVVGAAIAAVWYFVLREPETIKDDVATKHDTTGSAATKLDTTGSAGSATAMTGSAPDTTGTTGSAGSAVAMTGSAGSATTVVPTPGAKIVDTVVASSVAKGATVEIVGTDQKGPAPLTAKLEKDRDYKAHVTAPGFVAADVDVKGGQDKVLAKLVAKPKVITVTTEPPGADVLIDGVSTQKLTPTEVQLTAAQSARPRIRVTLRRPGYRPVDQFLETGAFTESDAKLTVNVDTKLTVAPKPTGGGTGGGTTTNNNNAGSGATTPTGTGSGSGTPTTTPPTGGTTPPAGGTTTPPAGGTTTTPPAGGATAPKPPATGTTTGSAAAPAGGTLQ